MDAMTALEWLRDGAGWLAVVGLAVQFAGHREAADVMITAAACGMALWIVVVLLIFVVSVKH